MSELEGEIRSDCYAEICGGANWRRIGIAPEEIFWRGAILITSYKTFYGSISVEPNYIPELFFLKSVPTPQNQNEDIIPITANRLWHIFSGWWIRQNTRNSFFKDEHLPRQWFRVLLIVSLVTQTRRCFAIVPAVIWSGIISEDHPPVGNEPTKDGSTNAGSSILCGKSS